MIGKLIKYMEKKEYSKSTERLQTRGCLASKSVPKKVKTSEQHNYKRKEDLGGKAFEYAIFDLLNYEGMINLKTNRIEQIQQQFNQDWYNQDIINQTEPDYWLPYIKLETEYDFIGIFKESMKGKLHLSTQNLVAGCISVRKEQKIIMVEVKKSFFTDIHQLLHQCFSQVAHYYLDNHISVRLEMDRDTYTRKLIYVWVCDGDQQLFKQRVQQLKQIKCLSLIANIYEIQFYCSHFEFYPPMTRDRFRQQIRAQIQQKTTQMNEHKERLQTMLAQQETKIKQLKQQEKEAFKKLKQQEEKQQIVMNDFKETEKTKHEKEMKKIMKYQEFMKEQMKESMKEQMKKSMKEQMQEFKSNLMNQMIQLADGMRKDYDLIYAENQILKQKMQSLKEGGKTE